MPVLNIANLAFYLAIFIPRYSSSLSNILFAFGTYAWNVRHHFFQMAFAFLSILILVLILNKPLKEWGFNFGEKEWSLTALKKFCLGWMVFLTIGTIINQILLGWPNIIWFEMTWQDFGLTLLFSSTMPGISEEIVFRSMVMGILSITWTERFQIGKLTISWNNLFSAIIFTFAHVSFTLDPFAIVSYEPMQLAFAFCLGIFYGIMLERTSSLLGPVLAHNFSDGFAVVLYTLVTFLVM